MNVYTGLKPTEEKKQKKKHKQRKYKEAYLDDFYLLLCGFDWFRGQSSPLVGWLHQCKSSSDWLEISRHKRSSQLGFCVNRWV